MDNMVIGDIVVELPMTHKIHGIYVKQLDDGVGIVDSNNNYIELHNDQIAFMISHDNSFSRNSHVTCVTVPLTTKYTISSGEITEMDDFTYCKEENVAFAINNSVVHGKYVDDESQEDGDDEGSEGAVEES
jgi:hypothetical protein